ncbi:MAG TPA: ABC transporter substrate-binding protein [Stellaceae bacterium]|nr:ABC transporter substrate-binding protein [Stellaceae bacterium]
MHKLLVSAPALLIAFGTAASAQTVKIGVINTLSGPDVQQGEMLERGLELYDKLHAKDLGGVKVELVKRDDTGLNPDTAKRLAQELVTRDHVNLITGFVWSPNFMAVAPVATQGKVPMVSLNAAALPAVGMSPFMVRTSFTLTQQAYPLGKWAAKQGYKKAYTAATDYAPGNEGAAAFTKSFTEAGGQVIGSVKFPAPPQTPDFAPFLQKVKDAKPDVLYVFVPAGAQATSVLRAVHDLDFKGAGITVISTEDLDPDEEFPNIGSLGVGLVTSGVYDSDATRPGNKEFVADYYKQYGTKLAPDFETADAWSGMKMIFDMIKATKGKFTGEQAMDFFSHYKDSNGPKGEWLIDPSTRQIVQNVYMRRLEMRNGKLFDTEFDNLGLMDAMGQPYAAK